jgi:hypothetical protein
METFQLLGLDFLAVLLVVLVGLDVVEHAVHSDLAARARAPAQRPSAATHAATVSCE